METPAQTAPTLSSQVLVKGPLRVRPYGNVKHAHVVLKKVAEEEDVDEHLATIFFLDHAVQGCHMKEEGGDARGSSSNRRGAPTAVTGHLRATYACDFGFGTESNGRLRFLLSEPSIGRRVLDTDWTFLS